MELSRKESEEKPKDLWKKVDAAEYQVKAIIFTINNDYNVIKFCSLNNNDFLIFKSSVSQFLLLMNQKRLLKKFT